MNATAEQPVQALVQSMSDRLTLGATAAAIISIFIIFHSFRENGHVLDHIPSVGKGRESARRKEFMAGGAKRLYAEGYRNFKDGIFRITTPRESPCVVVAPKFLPELNKLPEDVLSFSAATQELMHTDHIKIYSDAMQFPHVVKNFITPALTRLNPIVSETAQEAIDDELPQASAWTEVKINPKLVRIIAKVSGRLFIGPELCRDERYLDTAINFTIDVMKSVHTVAFMPVWMRPILTPIVPFVRTAYRRVRDWNELLRPVVASRRRLARDSPSDKPDNMLDWLIGEQTKAGIEDDNDLVQKQLGAAFAAVHTTTQTMMHIFYSLAAEPELVTILREEAREVLSNNGGQFTTQAIQDMKKLDSFVKELMRFYPLQASTFQRKVVKPFALSNGQVIPAGVIVEAPNGPICSDPEYYDNPEVFDALRFYKIRQTKDQASSGTKKAEVVANSQLVSTGALSLSWGYGRHACPGRFFAANEIKILTGKVLMQYDIKLPDGVTERYPNITYGDLTMPHYDKSVMLKRI